MSAVNAKSAAGEWLQQFVPGVESLKGRIVLMAKFQDEATCRFFYPRRAMAWQQQVNTFVSRAVRQRGGRVDRVTLSVAGYEEWLRGNGGVDSEDLRRRYADQQQGLPKAGQG